MSTTDIVLIVVIALMLEYAIFDEFIQPLRQGGTLLRVPLRRTNRLDTLIFIGLIGILIYQNIIHNGTVLTTTLLLSLVAMSLYLSYIRHPKLLFKATGFIYANIFIPYTCILNMNLSEDDIFEVDLEKRRLLINVQQLDNLKKIHNFMT